MVKIERQTFLYYHVYLLRDIKFTGYVANHFDTRKLTFAWQKWTLRIKQKNSNFDINKTFKASKMITWSLLAHHTKKRLIADYTLFSNWIKRFSNFLRLKFALIANHLAYIEPRWYRSQISADSQQNLISTKHDSSGTFLLVIFLKNRKEK